MSIDAVGAATTQATSAASVSATSDMTSAANKTGMDYDAFLQLLVAEMENQDPMKPTDSTQYIAQFASFSNVEQSIQTNKKLDTLLSATALTAAGSMVGRTATSADGAISGTIASVTVEDGGIVGTLEDGRTLSLDGGTRLE